MHLLLIASCYYNTFLGDIVRLLVLTSDLPRPWLRQGHTLRGGATELAAHPGQRAFRMFPEALRVHLGRPHDLPLRTVFQHSDVTPIQST